MRRGFKTVVATEWVEQWRLYNIYATGLDNVVYGTTRPLKYSIGDVIYSDKWEKVEDCPTIRELLPNNSYSFPE